MLRVLVIVVALAQPAYARDLRVLTDIAPLHSLVTKVLGEAPELLLAPGADPHHFTLAPSQVRAVAEADLLVWTGPEQMPWLDEYLQSANPDFVTLALGAITDATDTNYGHLWLDPAHAIAWLDQIAAQLIKIDPDNRARYTTGATRAKAELSELQQKLDSQLSDARSLGIITGHDAYEPFAERFGLTIIGAIADGHAAAPGAARLRHLRDLVTSGAAQCILYDSGSGPDYAAVLAAGHDVVVGALDPLGRDIEPGRELYDMLLQNLADAILECRP